MMEDSIEIEVGDLVCSKVTGKTYIVLARAFSSLLPVPGSTWVSLGHPVTLKYEGTQHAKTLKKL